MSQPEETQKIPFGLVERITFHNPQTGFCVLQVKAKGHEEPVVVTGSCILIMSGERIKAEGAWVQDRQYGSQFKSLNLRATPPTTLEGLEKYLLGP